MSGVRDPTCKIWEYVDRVENDESPPYYSYNSLLKRCKCVECMREKEVECRIKELMSK